MRCAIFFVTKYLRINKEKEFVMGDCTKDINTAGKRKMRVKTGNRLMYGAAFLLAMSCLCASFSGRISGQDNTMPTPRDVWERFEKNAEPMHYFITSDKIIRSETDSEKKLRRVEFSFSSQRVPYEREVDGKIRWEMKDLWHEVVIYISADPALMNEKKKGRYECTLRGDPPTACLVEVQDTARGSRGYVSSLPQNYHCQGRKRETSAPD